MAPQSAAPDLVPSEIHLTPGEADAGERLQATVRVENVGDFAAWSATVEVTDLWPDGNAVEIGARRLSRSLGPGDSEVVPLPHFIAAGVGGHTLIVRIVDVVPEDENPTNDARTLHFLVRAPTNDPEVPPDGDGVRIAALEGLGLAGIVVITVLALLGLVIVVAGRRRPKEPLTPPPAEPPDQAPPPIWPP